MKTRMSPGQLTQWTRYGNHFQSIRSNDFVPPKESISIAQRQKELCDQLFDLAQKIRSVLNKTKQ